MASNNGVRFMKQICEYFVKTEGFDRVIQKLKITGGGDGRCIAEFTVGQEDVNKNGTLHGGLTATLVDDVTTIALMSKPCHPGVSVDLHVSYLNPAKVGQDVIIDATTVRAGQKLAYIECELRRKCDNVILAKGAQTKFVSS